MVTTTKQLRAWLEDQLGGRITRNEWWKVCPTQPPPYSRDMMDDILSRLKANEKAKKPVPQRGKRAKLSEMQWLTPWQLPLDHWFVRMLRQPDERFEILTPLAKEWRELLGLSEPVPCGDLKQTLLRLGARERPFGVKILYPCASPGGELSGELVRIADTGGTSMLEDNTTIGYLKVAALYVPLDKILLIEALGLVNKCANLFGCHPAEAMAFYLCGIKPSTVTPKVFLTEGEVFIKVSDLMLSPAGVSKAYSYARNMVINELRGTQGKRVKPREATEKTKKLFQFIADNPNATWEQRFKDWNHLYPQWCYATIPSMRNVYSRATNRKIGGPPPR